MTHWLKTFVVYCVLLSSVVMTPLYAQTERVVPLGEVVSMVQQRYNATAVKTDTVREGDQLLYRIRLLSADKSRVWTVTVDARTGQML